MLADTVGASAFEPALQPPRRPCRRPRGGRGCGSAGRAGRAALAARVRRRRRGRTCPAAGRRRAAAAMPSRPTRRAPPAAPGVRHADRDRAAGAGLERHAAAVEVQDGLAREDVEARLERVQVRVHVPVLERDESSARCASRRSSPPISTCRVRPLALAGQRGLELDLLPADRAGTASCVRRGIARRPGCPRPRTYVLPATSSSSAGKRVITWLPSFVTTTSSSIRAAERPSVAAQ